MSSSAYVSREISNCKGCGASFIFTADEQKIFAERNVPAPVRCATCRELRSKERTKKIDTNANGNNSTSRVNTSNNSSSSEHGKKFEKKLKLQDEKSESGIDTSKATDPALSDADVEALMAKLSNHKELLAKSAKEARKAAKRKAFEMENPGQKAATPTVHKTKRKAEFETAQEEEEEQADEDDDDQIDLDDEDIDKFINGDIDEWRPKNQRNAQTKKATESDTQTFDSRHAGYHSDGYHKDPSDAMEEESTTMRSTPKPTTPAAVKPKKATAGNTPPEHQKNVSDTDKTGSVPPSEDAEQIEKESSSSAASSSSAKKKRKRRKKPSANAAENAPASDENKADMQADIKEIKEDKKEGESEKVDAGQKKRKRRRKSSAAATVKSATTDSDSAAQSTENSNEKKKEEEGQQKQPQSSVKKSKKAKEKDGNPPSQPSTAAIKSKANAASQSVESLSHSFKSKNPSPTSISIQSPTTEAAGATTSASKPMTLPAPPLSSASISLARKFDALREKLRKQANVRK